MSKTVRITLDVQLRPLTQDEIDDSGAEHLDEDCRPSGDDDDLDEVDPTGLADLIVYAVETSDDMWGGTNLYAAVDGVKVVTAHDLPA